MIVENLVSIITPAYNSEKTIKETIESVLLQTYTNWEMIIVNDCSSDNTLSIIEEFSIKDHRIKIINLKKNKGAANAWNEAFKVMQGEYLAFIDSDDLWIPEKLEKQIKYIKENNYAFIYSKYEWIDEQSKSLNKIIKAPISIDYKNMLKKNDIGLLTVMIDRKKVDIESIPIVYMAWDFVLWLMILKKGVIAYGMNEVLAYYRILSGSASRDKKKAAIGIWKIYHDVFHFSFVKRIYYFICYSLISLKRYYID